jgi:hypothetical protein
LEAAIVEKEVALVILDPIISRLGRKLDSHKDSDVRQALEPLAGLADRTGASILGIIHVNKTATTDPLNAVMGSRAFAATVRAVMCVMRDGDKRLLCFPKNNLAPGEKSVEFRIASKEVAKDDEDKPIVTAEVIWGVESERTAHDILADQVSSDKPHTTRDHASEWLAARLANGPAQSADVKGEAKALGIAERTLKRAAKDLGVAVEVSGKPPRSVWALPKRDAQTSLPAPGEDEGGL